MNTYHEDNVSDITMKNPVNPPKLLHLIFCQAKCVTKGNFHLQDTPVILVFYWKCCHLQAKHISPTFPRLHQRECIRVFCFSVYSSTRSLCQTKKLKSVVSDIISWCNYSSQDTWNCILIEKSKQKQILWSNDKFSGLYHWISSLVQRSRTLDMIAKLRCSIYTHLGYL